MYRAPRRRLLCFTWSHLKCLACWNVLFKKSRYACRLEPEHGPVVAFKMLTSAKYQTGTHDGKTYSKYFPSPGALRALRIGLAAFSLSLKNRGKIYMHHVFCFRATLWDLTKGEFLTRKMLKRFPSGRTPRPSCGSFGLEEMLKQKMVWKLPLQLFFLRTLMNARPSSDESCNWLVRNKCAFCIILIRSAACCK